MVVSFRSTLKRFSITKRILTFNIFLFPIFSYIMQFYVIPFKLYLEIKGLTAKAIITFAGTAFKYIFLIAPRDWFGYKTPIKDPWVQNLILITKYSNIQDFNGATKAPKIPDFGIYSLNMNDHTLATINTIITLHYQTHNSPFHSSYCKNNAITYKFIREAVFKEEHGEEIAAKLEKAGIQAPISQAKLLQDRGRLLNHRLPTHALVTHLFCNALTFDKGLNKAIPQPSRGMDPDHPFPCRLCGQADDDYRHVFGSCQVVELARQLYSKLIKIPISVDGLGFKDSLHLSLLAGGNGLTALSMNAIVIFNMTVWLTRTNKYVPTASTPDPGKAANYIANEAASLASSLYSSRNATSTKFGNAKNRTQEQEQAAFQMVQDILNTIEPSSCIFYTDGSARPNPGPCGAGTTMELPMNTHLTNKRLDFHAALGHGTNNLGEIWAIGMAIQTLQISTTKNLISINSAHIFSDSELAIGALTNANKVNKNIITNYVAITTIKKMIWDSQKTSSTFTGYRATLLSRGTSAPTHLRNGALHKAPPAPASPTFLSARPKGSSSLTMPSPNSSKFPPLPGRGTDPLPLGPLHPSYLHLSLLV